MYIIDKSFKKAPKSYVRQSLLAALVVAIILLFFRMLGGFVIIAALGASTSLCSPCQIQLPLNRQG